MTKAAAQQDSAKIAEEPKDTISIDNMDPTYYEEEGTERIIEHADLCYCRCRCSCWGCILLYPQEKEIIGY